MKNNLVETINTQQCIHLKTIHLSLPFYFLFGSIAAALTGCATTTPHITTAEVISPAPVTPREPSLPAEVISPAPVTPREPSLSAEVISPAPATGLERLQPGSPENGPPNQKTLGNNDENEKYINLTPFTTYRDSWRSSDVSKQNGAILSDSYTRLMITSDIKADGNNDKPSNREIIDEYPYEPRWWITRAIWSKEFSINFSTKVLVNSLEETVPLVTIGHDSNSEGEKWTRVIHHTDQAHPLFLVKGNGNGTIPKITITMRGSQSFTSRGAAGALGVVYGVANAVSPTSSVATKLTTQSTKDRATALDSAISKLFGAAVLEEHTLSSDLRLWNEEGGQPKGINVALSIPYPDENWDEKRTKVGTWTITFDYPRPSIFSDWRICGSYNPKIRCADDKKTAKEKVLYEIDSGAILNFVLTGAGNNLSTIRSHLAQQEWFTQGQAKLVRANSLTSGRSNAVKSAANQMCRNIRSTVTGLDLSGFDADIVVWAVFKGMPMPEGTPEFTEISGAPDCRPAIMLVENMQAIH